MNIHPTPQSAIIKKMAACRSEKHFFHIYIGYDVFQITVDFVFIYYNKAVYEHEKTANLQLIDVTGGFQLSLHAANTNSQRTVFTINMPPSFLLWWISVLVSARLSWEE